MALNLWPADAVTGAPSYAGRMLRQLVGAVWSSDQSRPDGGRSGILPGTPSSVCSITGTGPYTWNIGVHRGVLDKEASAIAGTYTYDLDASATGTVAAADPTNHRIDLLSIQLSDPAEGDGTAAPVATVVYTNGVAGSSPAAPAVPNSRCMAFAQINSPQSGGGAPVITLVAPYTTAVGGIIPCRSSAEYPPGYEGQYVDDASLNALLRYNGTGWDGAWTAYTPTLGNVTIGSGLLVGAFCLINKILHLKVGFKLGAGSGITGIVTVSLPAGFTTVNDGIEQNVLLKVFSGVGRQGGSAFIPSNGSTFTELNIPTSGAPSLLTPLGSFGLTMTTGHLFVLQGILQVQ